MFDEGLEERFVRFLKSPDRETYLTVHAALVSSEGYQPYSDELIKVHELVDAESFDEALIFLTAAMPNLLLNPSAHLARSFLDSKLVEPVWTIWSFAETPRCIWMPSEPHGFPIPPQPKIFAAASRRSRLSV